MLVALCERADWASPRPSTFHVDGHYLSREDLLAQSWFDSEEVYFLSTMQCGKYPNDVPAVNRTIRRRSTAGPVHIPAPPLLPDYNHNMGGVDLADNILKHYSIGRKTRADRRIINHGIKFL